MEYIYQVGLTNEMLNFLSLDCTVRNSKRRILVVKLTRVNQTEIA